MFFSELPGLVRDAGKGGCERRQVLEFIGQATVFRGGKS
jgi:hypothetical protein